MAINNNDIQNQINNLSSDVKKLTSTVNTLSRTLADSTRASKTSMTNIDRSISDLFKNKLGNAIREGLANAQDKSNDKLYKKTGELRDNQYVKKLINNATIRFDQMLEEQKVLLSTYNKDHKNNPEEDLTKVYEACKILVPEIKDWGESLALSKNTIRDILQKAEISATLNVTKGDKITISDFRQVIRDEFGGITGVLNTGGPFAIPKEDAKKLGKELNKVSAQLKHTQDTIKLTNDVVLDLATNSDTVNKIMLDMNVNMEMANENLRIFNMLLTSVGNAQWQQETSIKNNIQVMGQMRSMMTQMNATMRRLTDANTAALQNLKNTLNSKGTSNSGSTNTFQQQATRNSDRAKQAGFIALLIPALAKLLKKNTLIDTLLKYSAFMLGAGSGGMGSHPVRGAISYVAGPWIASSVLAKIFGSTKIAKNIAQFIGLGTKGTPTKGGTLRWGQFWKYWEGIKEGIQVPRDWNSSQIALRKAILGYRDITGVNQVMLKGGTTPTSIYQMGPVNTGYLAQDRGFSNALRMKMSLPNDKLLRRAWAIGNQRGGILGGLNLVNQITDRASRTRVLAKTSWLGRASGPLAFLGYSLEDVTGGKFGEATRKEGFGGFLKQAGKTAVGAGAGAWGAGLGAIKGAAIGASLGALTGPLAVVVSPLLGLIGALIGGLAGGKIFKGFADFITNNGNKNQRALATQWKTNLNVQNKFYAGVLDRLAILTEPILRIWEWIKDKFHIGENTPGGNNNTGGMPSNERNQMQHEINRQEKKAKEEKKKYKQDQELFDELEKYASGGKSKKGEKEFNRLLEQYKSEYANTKVRGTSVPSIYAKKSWWDSFGKLHMGDSDLKAQHDAEVAKLKNTDEAYQHAMKRITEYRLSQKNSLAARKQRIENADYIDPTQLVSSQFLKTHTQSEVIAALSKNTGAYEKLQDKKGYWNISHNSFQHDVEYAGKGTQKTLQALVDGGYIPAGFSITSAMGARGDKDNKLGHSGDGHYRSQGNVLDLVWGSDAIQKVAAQGGYYNGKYYKGMGAAKQAGLVGAFADERPGTEAYKWARGGSTLHTEVTNSIAGYNATKAAEQVAQRNVTNATKTIEETASSNTRSVLADIVGAKNKSDKQEKARSVIFSAVDVTGSLGVWGITQLNNGVMRTGR